MKRLIACLVVGCALCCALPASARAQAAVAGLLGYGSDFKDSALNRFGFELGARAGYTFASHLYVGGMGALHVGEKTQTIVTDYSWRMIQSGGEVGYDVKLEQVIVRPYLGLGVMWEFVKKGDQRETPVDAYFSLGGTAMYPLGQFFAAGDARFVTVLADPTYTGIVLSALVGWVFGGDGKADDDAEGETDNVRSD